MERLLTRRLVANIGNFDSSGAPVTSVYLRLARSKGFRKTALVEFKDLVTENSEAIYQGRTHADKQSIKQDVRKIVDFLDTLKIPDVAGVALFSCSREGFFEQLGLPVAFPPQIIVALRPSIAPLVTILEDYKRISICAVDRRSARLFEYFMGRVEEVTALSDNVPGRVKVAGWGGWQESNISRSIEHQEMAHLKNTAEVLHEQFRLRGADWLFLAARPDTREAFERVLPASLRERLKGYVDVTFTSTIDQVRAKTMELADKLKSSESRKTVDRLVETASSGGPAVLGLRKVIEALNLSAVGTLVVRQGLAAGGVLCGGCGLLGIRKTACRLCGKGMQHMDNIIEAVEEAALAQGAGIRHVAAGSPLDGHDGIGAFTRFKVGNTV